MDSARVVVLYEDTSRSTALFEELARRGIPFEKWFIHEGILLPTAPPAPDWKNCVFFSRLSPSAKERDHGRSLPFGRIVLSWLEAHELAVWNGSRALDLDTSKSLQVLTLSKYGIDTPRSTLVVGKGQLVETARRTFGPVQPFYCKPDQGGSGTGVQCVEDADTLAFALRADKLSEAPNDLYLLQEAIGSRCGDPSRVLYRAEFVAGELVYTMRIVAQKAHYSLCPCDAWRSSSTSFTRLAAPPPETNGPAWVRFLEGVHAFMMDNAILVCGIEFAFRPGVPSPVVFDVNMNTNYAPHIEADMDANHGGGALARLAQSLASQFMVEEEEEEEEVEEEEEEEKEKLTVKLASPDCIVSSHPELFDELARGVKISQDRLTGAVLLETECSVVSCYGDKT